MEPCFTSAPGKPIFPGGPSGPCGERGRGERDGGMRERDEQSLRQAHVHTEPALMDVEGIKYVLYLEHRDVTPPHSSHPPLL